MKIWKWILAVIAAIIAYKLLSSSTAMSAPPAGGDAKTVKYGPLPGNPSYELTVSDANPPNPTPGRQYVV